MEQLHQIKNKLKLIKKTLDSYICLSLYLDMNKMRKEYGQ